MNIKIDTSLFNSRIRAYARETGRAISDVLIQQAKLLAKRLMDLTFPKNAAQGKKRVEYDLNKVYQRNEWFTDTFSFRNKKLGDRVKEAVLKKDATTLESVFDRSSRLRRLEIEEFTPQRHKSVRNNRGGVSSKDPFSFPLRTQVDAKKYKREEQKNVGTAKAGWARCFQLLGGAVPGWLSNGYGAVVNRAMDTTAPFIEIVNKVRFAESLMRRTNAVNRALSGRVNDMNKAMRRELDAARRKAGLSGR